MKKSFSVNQGARKNKKFLWIGVPLIVLAIGIGIYFFAWLPRQSFQEVPYALNFIAFDEVMNEAAEGSVLDMDKMLARTRALLIDGGGRAPMVTSGYLLPGALLRMTPLYAPHAEALDQISLLRVYIRLEDRKAADALSDYIYENYLHESGLLCGRISEGEVSVDDLAEPEARLLMTRNTEGPSLQATTAYVRALLEYQAVWGKTDDWSKVVRFVDAIYDEATGFYCDVEYITSAQNPELYIAFFNPNDFSKMEKDEQSYRAFQLSALDLYAFSLLAQADSAYQEMYDSALALVEGGRISDTLPLYAEAYSPDNGGYVYHFGSDRSIPLLPSMYTMLHLAEVGRLAPESKAFLETQIFNVGYLYSTYDLFEGSASSSDELTSAYGLALQIAAVTGNSNLYVRTLDQMSRFVATLNTSPGKDLIFKKVVDQRNIVFAEDNLQAMLGLPIE
ncbi:MAG: hypothetical protein GXY06_02265 [Clostridiaceae bacterium]|nr:hypothetical protein [Clostridiaceae bacterium]